LHEALRWGDIILAVSIMLVSLMVVVPSVLRGSSGEYIDPDNIWPYGIAGAGQFLRNLAAYTWTFGVCILPLLVLAVAVLLLLAWPSLGGGEKVRHVTLGTIAGLMCFFLFTFGLTFTTWLAD
jgi:hypothetical protein